MSLHWEVLIPRIAHDVRTLVRKGISNAQLLEREMGPAAIPAVSGHIRAILESQQDLNRLFIRLVALADARAAVQRALTHPEETITLDLAVLGAKMELRDSILQANAELIVSELPVCDVPRKTQVVLVELIDNSLRYRDLARPLRIAVDAEETGGKIRVRLTDNGSGFDPVYAANLFEPFQRLDAMRSGFGLGLAISREIIEASGGRIYCEPAERGAVFVFELEKCSSE